MPKVFLRKIAAKKSLFFALLASILVTILLKPFPSTEYKYEQEFFIKFNHDSSVCLEGGRILKNYDKQTPVKKIEDRADLNYNFQPSAIKLPVKYEFCVTVNQYPEYTLHSQFIRLEITDFQKDIIPNSKECFDLEGVKENNYGQSIVKFIERSTYLCNPSGIDWTETGKVSIDIKFQPKNWVFIATLVFVGVFIAVSVLAITIAYAITHLSKS